MIDDEKDYLSIRYKLQQQQPGANQTKTTKNAQKVHFDTEINNGEQCQKPNVTTIDPTQKEKFQKTLIVHCRHERRLEDLKRDMHRIYDSAFRGTVAMHIKLIIGHTNNRSVIGATWPKHVRIWNCWILCRNSVSVESSFVVSKQTQWPRDFPYSI